ncbi:WD40/YVTN/BNR-like repeat-containing protein [Parachitinimonas caeni]|uniref:Exo-alpha-sialidase n=1 Tax=Parachitinimonas caeni TaxID=3031301 RepID=A0ABT7DTU3_9NEIS|nr:sialidase family protein [Parachitinimonas caeni]MDK2123389.1 exo-alpha-sialidase [Parachitinimonas caeni]
MSKRILVGSRKGLFVFEHDAEGWQQSGHHFAGAAVTAVLAEGPVWLVALRHGHFGPKLHRSDDAGQTWRELGVPAFDPEEADKPAVDTIWCLTPAGRTLWAGCLPPGLFRSDDGGESWQLNRSLWDRPERKEWFGGGADDAGIHSVVADPAVIGKLTVGVSCGGVWRSDDDGQSWRQASAGMWAAYMPPERRHDPNIQDPHRLAVCRDARQYWWCQHHNAIFRSDDDCQSWQELCPAAPLSHFGFAVAAHPADPQTAWFVPAQADECRIPENGDFYVLRTEDGGASFRKLNQGLPSSPAYHLVFRHALEVGPDGQDLAMASTTGSLWVSMNGGDSWQRLSAELPPVYCLVWQQAAR